MKRLAPVSAGSYLACVVDRPTLVGACHEVVDGATDRGEPTVRSSMASVESTATSELRATLSSGGPRRSVWQRLMVCCGPGC